jgi:hypothetical protein
VRKSGALRRSRPAWLFVAGGVQKDRGLHESFPNADPGRIGRDGGSARPGICGGACRPVWGLPDVPWPRGGCGVFGWEEWLTVGRASIIVPAGGAARCVAGGGLPGRRGVKPVAPGGRAVGAGGPGRKGNTIGVSVQSPVAGFPAALRPGIQVGEQGGEQASGDIRLRPATRSD